MTRLPRRVKDDQRGRKRSRVRQRLLVRWYRRLADRYRAWEHEHFGSEPHVVGTDAPTPENDPIGRFRACSQYRPDHNGECLNCDEPLDAHGTQTSGATDTTSTG